MLAVGTQAVAVDTSPEVEIVRGLGIGTAQPDQHGRTKFVRSRRPWHRCLWRAIADNKCFVASLLSGFALGDLPIAYLFFTARSGRRMKHFLQRPLRFDDDPMRGAFARASASVRAPALASANTRLRACVCARARCDARELVRAQACVCGCVRARTRERA